jgi:xanthine dehydrogenase YagR molybdenum-binding subunit
MADDAGGLIGRPAVRVDGVAKVTGQARYASDETVPHPAYAWLVTSSIAKGKVREVNTSAARAVPGVLDILTHDNVVGAIRPLPGPDGGATTTTLDGDQVWHAGQIVAVVIADTWEIAREAGHKVVVSYAPERPSATIGSPGTTTEPRKTDPKKKDPKIGDAASAFAAAPVKVDARFATPTQHHNPLELFTTTCVWDGPKLTIYEPSQTMWGTKANIAKQLGIDPSMVRVVSRYVGGAFGSKGGPTARTAWVALAAKRLNRPVKLVPTRADGFTIATYRAETRQHLQLGATRDGKLTALIHEGWEVTSRPSGYNVAGVESTARMYACPNVSTAVNVVHADRATPGFMRAPPEVPYMFALESGMDELAHALSMDPIDLRRVNDTQKDPVTGLPFSSRSLMACYDQAAAKFGWSRRNPRPTSMRDGDWMIGWGCATACYPSNIGPAAARLSLSPQGQAQIGLAGHEIGTGAYTVVAIVVAEGLGLDTADVRVLMGDSDLPPVTVAGGSNNAASTAHVAAKACEEIRSKLAGAAIKDPSSVFAGANPSTLRLAKRALVGPDGKKEQLPKAIGRVTGGSLEVLAENTPEGMPPETMAGLHQGKMAMQSGSGRKDVTAYAFGAHLVEVHIHRLTCEIRAPRVVSAFAAGTIVNPLTAYSQYMGGAIWGLSSALHEATEIDEHAARYVNISLADYLIPVNADIGQVDVILVPEADERVNPLGIKGIGEIGIVGMNAAVANAVFHATGKRVRELPIRLEHLI